MKKIIALTLAAAFVATSTTFAAGACCAGCEKAEGKNGTMNHAAMMQHEGHHAIMQGANGKASAESQALVGAYEALSNAVFDGEMDTIKAKAANLVDVAVKQDHSDIAESARAVASAGDVNMARKAFTKLSGNIINAVENEPGFYVMSCPMVQNGQWLQSSKEIHNPYMGSSMPKCGVVKKATGSDS